MTTQELKPITGTVSKKFIEKVDRYFNHSKETIIVELIQNARRAGATEMRWAIEPAGPEQCSITVTDDGCGVEDPAVLLTLGESGWDAGIQTDEDPAGAGFFSLCGLSGAVHVSSHNWRMTLDKAVFTHGKETLPCATKAPIKGMRLEFITNAEKAEYYAHHTAVTRWMDAVEKCSKYCGLKVRINDKRVKQEDFLADAEAVVEWNGVRIGIHNRQKLSVFAHNHDANTANFHGCVLTTPKMPEVGDLGDDGKSKYAAILDIRNTQHIKLVLPARNGIVQDANWELLKTHIERLLTEHGLKRHEGKHRMPFTAYQRLKASGIELPEAVPYLKAVCIKCRDQYSELQYPEFDNDMDRRVDVRHGHPVLVPNLDDNGLNLTMAIAFACNSISVTPEIKAEGGFDADGAFELPELADSLNMKFVRANSNFSGYSWYDRLPFIEEDSVKFTVKQGEHGVYTSEGQSDALHMPQGPDELASEILVDFIIEKPTKDKQSREKPAGINLQLETVAYFRTDDCSHVEDGDWSFSKALLSADSGAEPTIAGTAEEANARGIRDQAENWMLIALCDPPDDSDSDDCTSEAQSNWVTQKMKQVLLSPEKAFQEAIEAKVHSVLSVDEFNMARRKSGIIGLTVEFEYGDQRPAGERGYGQTGRTKIAITFHKKTEIK